MFYFSTLFINDYHFTHYDNVKIEKNVKTAAKWHNDNVTIRQVTFSAKDRHGEKKRFCNEFVMDYPVQSGDYYDLIGSSTYETYNTWKSLVTWIPAAVLIILSVVLIVDECDEDSDNLKQFFCDRVDHWAEFKRFMGGDEEAIQKVIENERHNIEDNYRYYNWDKTTWARLNKKYSNYAS